MQYAYPTNILANKPLLEQINPNFAHITSQVHQLRPPSQLSPPLNTLQSFQAEFFLSEFNSSDQKSQITFLSILSNLEDVLSFITSDPFYSPSITFLDELVLLTKKEISIQNHLSFHIRDFLLTLGVSYSDELRAKFFKILLLLLNEKDPEDKLKISGLNKLIYEPLYDFDVYYNEIKSVTTESVIISLSPQEVDLLIEGQVSDDLKEKITQGIEQLGGSAFFKMHRSPKDCFSLVNQAINEQWVNYWGLQPEENPERCFMRIRNTEQMLLLCKYSERIKQDLQEFRGNVKIILRKWESLGTEFRCFVCNGALNAVSGYGFEEIDFTEKERLEQFINSKEFIDIMTGIPYSHAVIDCGIDREYKVKIIELNPFGKASSAAKFSWVLDKKTLCNGYKLNANHVTIRL